MMCVVKKVKKRKVKKVRKKTTIIDTACSLVEYHNHSNVSKHPR